ncbi:hypothetical protein A1O1_03581 [Capronia coronata CBS 617.96]|uniref:Uracil catabolism protein 4 n=1 Tax=Capronia coronata CBS 617.96 TaxID=1182541 RepID=W9YD90_9EURO|nr:uncharacterized protein A1O1_03581 [Capronia coronata CBS 617.96]EXJ90478.1 hypothetical protein A1O1_03581 [Capronia coronata CBS 617.96]
MQVTPEVKELLSLQAVRRQAQKVLAAAERGELLHFDYDADEMSSVADFVSGVIARDFGPDRYHEIPPHGRWQHFDVGGVPRVAPLLARWKDNGCTDEMELTRRLIDLFSVSVLLDAGAGNVWRFNEPGHDRVYSRSEGIAVASLYMFTAGAFTTDQSNPESVNGQGLSQLDEATFSRHFQLSPQNPMVGVSSRVQLLNRVGQELRKLPAIFGPEGRPGNLVDHLVKSAGSSKVLDVELLWSCLQQLLIPSWPEGRTRINGQPIGDAWPLQVLAHEAEKQGEPQTPTTSIQPFHKLTQWLAYSLMVPFVRILGLAWTNQGLLTGLPEYRNGGLFVDMKALRLKPEALAEGLRASGEELPGFSASGDVIVEWRAMTVALLDKLYAIISSRLAAQGVQLSMAQMLEAGSWKAGRELAAKYRPATGSSPILIEGDGTLF